MNGFLCEKARLSIMAHGSSHDADRTPPVIAQHCREMVTLPKHELFAVGDLTCGSGDFLLPFVQANVRMIGTEISRDRALVAAKVLPKAAIYTTALEHMHLPPESLGLIVAHPPCVRADGTRIELSMLRRMLKYLMKHGVFIAIVPMRQWDAHMVDLFARQLYDVQAFKFPDLPSADEASFARATQAVIIGKKRATPTKTADEALVTQLKGWRYRTKGVKVGESAWVQGYPLPDLPALPWPDAERYGVPLLRIEPVVTVFHASHAEIHEALEMQGMHKTEAWKRAVTHHDHRMEMRPWAMPLVGKVHLAALILARGLFDGRILTGPDGVEYMFSSSITTRWQAVEVDDDEEERHIVEKKQLQDVPILGVLNLATGQTDHYYGSQAYEYLDAWYPILAKIILREYQPLYDLNPDDWMIRVALSVATDKHLPGAEPGLISAQLHRTFAHWYTTLLTGKLAFLGERGVGKTRILIVLMALYVHYWSHRTDTAFLAEQKIQRRPRWVKRLRAAWKKSWKAKGAEPRALPLAIVTPKRVTRTWLQELEAAWPAAKVVNIRSFRDVDTWMELAAAGTCEERGADDMVHPRSFEAVVAVFSQSSTRAMQLDWRPAVIEVPQGTKIVNDLEVDGVPEFNERGRLIAKRDPETGELLTKEQAYSHFYCPTCGGRIEATPQNQHQIEEDDDVVEEDALTLENDLRPVEQRDWFTLQPRWCQRPLSLKERRGGKHAREQEAAVCGAPLWTRQRREVSAKKLPQLPFAVWAREVEARPCASISTVSSTSSGSVSPFDYFCHFYSGCCAFVGLDEFHNMFGVNTDVARAGHHIMNASGSRVPASGTFWEGLDKFFRGWYRYAPEFWKSLGIGWKDLSKAIREYGVVLKVTREYVVARKGTPTVERSTSIQTASGVSARFLPLILPDMAFLDALDVGAYMPPKEEVPVLVSMREPELVSMRNAWEAELNEATRIHLAAQQEYERLTEVAGVTEEELSYADLAQAEALERVQKAEEALSWVRTHDMEGTYRRMEADLRSRAKAGDRAVQIQMQTLLARWCAYPFDPPLTITQTLRGEWGEKRGKQVIYTAPTLAPDYITPPERALMKIVAKERSEVIPGTNPPRSRVCLIFYRQSNKRDVGARLAQVLIDHHPWVLPARVAPEDREQAILQAVAEGYGVILAPISKVSEGLNLKLDTPICYELGKNAKETDQAIDRCRRLGKEELVRAYYVACENTATHDKLSRQANASSSASLFGGNSPRGELAAFVGADKVALAKVAQRLETIEDLTAAFARKREAWEAEVLAGRNFLGYDDDPLPARLAIWRERLARASAERTSMPIVEATGGSMEEDGYRVKESLLVEHAEEEAILVPVLSEDSHPLSERPPLIHHTERSPALAARTSWEEMRIVAEQRKAVQRKHPRQKGGPRPIEERTVPDAPVQISLFEMLSPPND